MMKNIVERIIYLQDKRIIGFASGLAGSVLISFDSIYIRLSGTGGVNTVFLFGLFAMISMFSLVQMTDERRLAGTLREDGWPLVLSGLLMLGSATTFILSIKHTIVANTVIIMGGRPVVTALFSWFFLKEKANRNLIIAIGVLLAGFSVVMSGSAGSGHLLGDFYAFLTVVFLGLNGTLQRHYKKISRSAVVGMAGFFMAVVMFYFADIASFTWKTWVVMGIMGLTTAPAGRVLNAVSTRYILAAESAMMTLSVSVFAPIWAILLFGERPSFTTLAGGVLIIGTIFVYIAVNFGIMKKVPPVL
jgi:drug/metabolite transporter (DMT)-like permease